MTRTLWLVSCCLLAMPSATVRADDTARTNVTPAPQRWAEGGSNDEPGYMRHIESLLGKVDATGGGAGVADLVEGAQELLVAVVTDPLSLGWFLLRLERVVRVVQPFPRRLVRGRELPVQFTGPVYPTSQA